MSTSIKQQYAELVSLTQLFLLREYSLKDKCLSHPRHHAFFKSWLGKPSPSPSPKPAQSLTRPQQSASSTQPPIPDPRPAPTPPSPDPQPLPTKPGPITPTPDPLPPSTPPEYPTPPSTPPEIIHKKTAPAVLALEPIHSPAFSNSEDHGFKQILKQFFPQYTLSETIPDDSLAKKIMNAWSLDSRTPPVVILSFNDQEKHLTLLKNIAKAISLRLVPAKVLSGLKLEKEKQWDSLLNSSDLRLIIASDYGLYLQPGLMKYYREASKQNKHFLHQTPLLLLSDLDLYLKEPQLKSLLWRAICNEVAAAQSI